MKAMKTYSINPDVVNNPKNYNIFSLNPTCKAIVKTMFEEQRSMTGQEILECAIEKKLWSTRQAQDRYMTTWAFYVKKLKDERLIVETGRAEQNQEEYLA